MTTIKETAQKRTRERHEGNNVVKLALVALVSTMLASKSTI